MNEQAFYDNLYELSPQYPLTVLDFLKTKLKLGKKYVVLDVHTHNGQLSKLLKKHVYLVCSLTTDPSYYECLKVKFKDSPNLLSLNEIPELTNIEADSIDCICIDDTFFRFDTLRLGIEFERILRLNSYVLFLQNRIHSFANSFTEAYQKFVEKYYPEVDIVAPIPSELKLEAFYGIDYKQEVFQNQQRLDWQYLKQYFLTVLETHKIEARDKSLQELKALFDKHEKGGQVVLEYQTILYYGLFNHSVPEISLRKSIFFNILRPFAFCFYVLVKANIYFWRALFKIKEKVFRSRSDA
jgi:hypothetical protein